MTNKEAIKYLQQLYPNGGHCWLDEQRIEAIGMAIKALQKEPISEKKCMFTKDSYTNEDRKVLCDDCDEECGYSKKGEPVSEFLNTESMIESYKQRLISQANGVKNSPLIDMCLASYKHGINETLDMLKLSNIQRTTKNWKEPVSEDLKQAAVQAFKQIVDDERNSFLEIFEAGANWQKQQDNNDANHAFVEQIKTQQMWYEKGMADMKQQLMANATPVTVYIDAGGYPYIPQLELYDYDKDVPLAKEGDKYKVILIKEK